MSTLTAAHHAWARSLWALCYRMTGVAADADELVQETFVRALEMRPHESADEPLHPWLFKVATRLCIDRLRKRRTEGYRGPWLPAPVADDLLQFEAPPSARYEMMESASYAFLLALEALSPEQRAAVILRDVFDFAATDVAAFLDTSEANVRQLQHRSRKALERYERERLVLDVAQREKHRDVLQRFFTALATNDVEAARDLLAPNVQMLSDGAGIYHAAMVPIVGAERTWLFMRRLLEIRGLPLSAEMRGVNGLWAIDATLSCAQAKDAPRAILGVLLDAAGRIALLYSVMAPVKLSALPLHRVVGPPP